MGGKRRAECIVAVVVAVVVLVGFGGVGDVHHVNVVCLVTNNALLSALQDDIDTLHRG